MKKLLLLVIITSILLSGCSHRLDILESQASGYCEGLGYDGFKKIKSGCSEKDGYYCNTYVVKFRCRNYETDILFFGEKKL